MSEAKLLAKNPPRQKSPARQRGRDARCPLRSWIHQRQFKRRAFGEYPDPAAGLVLYLHVPAHRDGGDLQLYQRTYGLSDYKFVGLHQYIKMFTADPIFTHRAAQHRNGGALHRTHTLWILSVLLANGLNAMTSKWQKFYTFVYFLPSVLPGVWLFSLV